MAQTRDLNSVLKLIDFTFQHPLAAGTYTSKAKDLRAAITNSDLSEVVTRILLALLVEFGAAGTVDITVQHSDNDSFGWANLGTLSQANATDGETFYNAEFGNLKRYVRLVVVVTGTVSSITILGVGDHGLREPVVQTGTALTYTAA